MLKKGLLTAALLACTVALASAQQAADPCQSIAKVSVPINQIASSTALTGAASRKNYICALNLAAAGAATFSLIEAPSGACGASTPIALIGATTAASGLSLAANGVFNAGSGSGTVAKGSNAGYDVCLLQTGGGRVSGVMMIVQQ